jgi:hypothetical protein
MAVRQYPVIITVRDRLSCLQRLLSWLDEAGQKNIWLCDNGSSYPPLVEFLNATNHHVVFNKFNLGHRAPWLSGLVPQLGNEKYFIVSDPDVVPDENTPSDVFEIFEHMLHSNPKIDKVGFSLRIDELPDHFIHKSDVITWETQFWQEVYWPGFYKAPIDTTFAMYRPGLGHQNGNSLRSAPPYTARHLPWYQDFANLSEEDEYYVKHSDHLITNWNTDKLPANVRVQLTKLRAQQSAAE